MHFLTDKLSLHVSPPQLTFVLPILCGNTWKNMIDRKAQAEE